MGFGITDFKRSLAESLAPASGLTADEAYALIESPPDGMGDFAVPCFSLAKKLKKAPNAIAADVAVNFSPPPFIIEVKVVGAFLNFYLDPGRFTAEVVRAALDRGFGKGEPNGEMVVLDFSSPNTAKRFHAGHLYSTIIGNSLSKIFAFLGCGTYRINYLGDWGTQFGKLITAYKHWGDAESVEERGVEELERLYVMFHDESERDPSLNDEARGWLVKMQDGDGEALELWKRFNDVSLREYEKQYKRLGVEFDSYLGESFYNDKRGVVIDALRDKGLLKESDGAMIVDLSEYDMPPCLILRSDGGALYPTRDLAAAIYRKNTYKFTKAIYVTDARQSLHFAQWFKVIGLMGFDWEDRLVHVPYGLLSLQDGPLSSRHGNVILLSDLMDEGARRVGAVIDEKNPSLENRETVAEQVGIGALVFGALYNSRVKDNVFTLDKALSFEGETGPYAQYTHARTAGVLNKAGITDDDYSRFADADLTLLDDDCSLEIAKLLADFPSKVALAAERYEPFVVARFVIALCQAFNKFYHDCPILSAETEGLKTARLALTAGVRGVLAAGLGLLGVAAPDKM